MAQLPYYCRSLESSSTVRLHDGDAKIVTSGSTDPSRPIYLFFGPLMLSVDAGLAVELGNELIRAAHHWQAARAELVEAMQAEQAGPAVQE